jgi:hypothetical protein
MYIKLRTVTTLQCRNYNHFTKDKEKVSALVLVFVSSIESHYITTDKSQQYTQYANQQIKCTDQTQTFHSQRPPHDEHNI